MIDGLGLGRDVRGSARTSMAARRSPPGVKLRRPTMMRLPRAEMTLALDAVTRARITVGDRGSS